MKIILLLFVSVLSKLYLPIQTVEKQQKLEQSGNVMPVSNYNNIAFTTGVSIGTPAQVFNLLLDTASSDLWVVSDTCIHCNKPSNVFYPSQSTTYSNKLTPIRIDPQFSSAGALLGTDDIGICGLTANSQEFAVVVSDLTYQGADWDGVLGLGFNNSYNNLIQNFFTQGLIEEPLFSFYLSNAEDDTSLSFMILGAVDKNYYKSGTLSYIPIIGSQNVWTVDVDAIQIGGMPVVYLTQALFDIGTSLILAPEDDFHTISEIFRLNYGCVEGEQVICSCSDYSKYQNINFKFGKNEQFFSIPPQTYFAYNSTTEMCVLLLGQAAPSMPWVLGSVFMREYYTVFSMSTDYNAAQIGLAQKSQSPGRHHNGGSSDEDDLLGLIIGLPIGAVIAITAGGTAVFCCIIRRRKAKKARENKENQQKLIIYVGGEAPNHPKVPSFAESADERNPVGPVVVVSDPDKNTQTVFYPYLPPVADS